jgi:hypothetical protein
MLDAPVAGGADDGVFGAMNRNLATFLDESN